MDRTEPINPIAAIGYYILSQYAKDLRHAVTKECLYCGRRMSTRKFTKDPWHIACNDCFEERKNG